jgi:hypothetical protein
MLYEILDPVGFTHTVLIEDGKVYGAENLCHTFPVHERDYIKGQLLHSMVMTMLTQGDYLGFKWQLIKS